MEELEKKSIKSQGSRTLTKKINKKSKDQRRFVKEKKIKGKGLEDK
jgi:hypothetical protein